MDFLLKSEHLALSGHIGASGECPLEVEHATPSHRVSNTRPFTQARVQLGPTDRALQPWT